MHIIFGSVLMLFAKSYLHLCLSRLQLAKVVPSLSHSEALLVLEGQHSDSYHQCLDIDDWAPEGHFWSENNGVYNITAISSIKH